VTTLHARQPSPTGGCGAATQPRIRLVRPVEWLAGPVGRRYGYAGMLSLAGGYTLAIVLLARQGAMPVPAPFLRIPDESYYLWSAWFIGPVLLAGWLVAAAAMQLSARALGEGARSRTSPRRWVWPSRLRPQPRYSQTSSWASSATTEASGPSAGTARR
jgi:hypothetical protein